MKNLCSGIAILYLIVSMPVPALAAARTWDGGGGDDDWQTAANWDVVPVNADTLHFAGTTRLNPVNDFPVAPNIQIDGIVFNAGAGAFTLTGNAIDQAGPNIINNSTSFQTINLDMALMNPNININASSGSLAFGGIVSGGGKALTKIGDQTLFLSGANSYTGLTDVQAGTLSLSGGSAIFDTANVQISGGTLEVATSETVNDVDLNTGTIHLGSNVLTVGGDYDQLAAATLGFNIMSSTAAGSVAVAGNGSIAAASIFDARIAGVYIPSGSTWDVVTAGTGVGLNAPTLQDNSFVVSLTATVVGGTTVRVTANRVNAYDTLSTNDDNDDAVGAALEQAGKGGASGDMISVLGALDGMGSAAEITAAIETMTPDVSSGAAEASRAMAGNSLTMISNRLGGARSLSECTGVSSGEMLNGVGVWIQGLGSHRKQGERKGIQGYHANLFGTTIGADRLIDSHFRMGVAGSYGWARVKSKTPGSSSDDINSFQGAVYGSYDSLDLCKARQGGPNANPSDQTGNRSPEAVRSQAENAWYADGMLAFSQNQYDSRREIWLTPITKRLAKADHYGQQYSTQFESGYKFVFEKTKSLELTPFAGLAYNYLRMNQYKEKGADALNLTVQGEGFHQLEQTLGTKFSYPMVARKLGTFIPSAKAAWLYDYFGDRFETTASFAGDGTSFNTQGAQPAKNGMLLGAEIAFLNMGHMTVAGNWDLELRDQFVSNTYYGTLRYEF